MADARPRKSRIQRKNRMKQLSGKIKLEKTAKPGPDNGPGVYLLTVDLANSGELCLVGEFPLSKTRGNTVELSAGANGLAAFSFAGNAGDSIVWLKVAGSGFGHNPAA